MSFGFCWIGKSAGAFQNNIYIKLFPWQICGIAFVEKTDRFSINNDIILIKRYFSVINTINGVVFNKMRESFRRTATIVYSDYFGIGTIQGDLKGATSDSNIEKRVLSRCLFYRSTIKIKMLYSSIAERTVLMDESLGIVWNLHFHFNNLDNYGLEK